VTELDALYFAVCREPADDTPRLVAADWLDEHGDELYARFIREQIAAAREPACRPACASDDCAACARARWIERTNRSPVAIAWRALPSGIVSGGSIERGFAFAWAGTVEQYLAHRDALFARYPVTSVWLSERHPLVRLTSSYSARWVRASEASPCASGRHVVPADLFDAMTEGLLSVETDTAGQTVGAYRDYVGGPHRNLGNARNDLHAAAVAVARARVGLPPVRPTNQISHPEHPE